MSLLVCCYQSVSAILEVYSFAPLVICYSGRVHIVASVPMFQGPIYTSWYSILTPGFMLNIHFET